MPSLQSMFPPKPKFTEKDLPNLQGKIYIVTGGSNGIGKELVRMLYSKNAKVYIASRSEDKANRTIKEIQTTVPASTGSLNFLHLDLSDLTTIKASALKFLSLEKKLHVLFNNAGVMLPPQEKSPQSYEGHIAINNLAPCLFTELLTPTLAATAKSEPPNTVRVVWVASSGAEYVYDKSVGIPLDNLDYHIEKPPLYKYSISKLGNYLHGVEYAKRHKADRIISVPLDPGNLRTNLYDRTSLPFWLFSRIVTHPVYLGAYTELFAGLSPTVTIDKSGSWVAPWGRITPIGKDLVKETMTEAEGGTGAGGRFWKWTEDQIRGYL